MHPETPGVYNGWNAGGVGALLKAEAPLSWAAGGGHLDCVDYLVKAGHDVERGSQLGPFGTVMKASPLFAAAHGGHLKVIFPFLIYTFVGRGLISFFHITPFHNLRNFH